MSTKPRRRRIRPPKGDAAYHQLWRIVEGAVADAFRSHPDYLTDKGRRHCVSSVSKRVTGAILGYAHQKARAREGAGADPGEPGG